MLSTLGGADRLSKIRRYRRLLFGSVLGGTLAFIVASELGYTLVGLVLYWVGLVVFVGIWQGTSVTLFDERDRELERKATLVTVQICTVILVVAMSVVVALEETRGYEPPPEFSGVLLGFGGMAAVFAVVYTAMKYRP